MENVKEIIEIYEKGERNVHYGIRESGKYRIIGNLLKIIENYGLPGLYDYVEPIKETETSNPVFKSVLKTNLREFFGEFRSLNIEILAEPENLKPEEIREISKDLKILDDFIRFNLN